MPFTNPNTHSMGGKALAAKFTPEERRIRAQKAGKLGGRPKRVVNPEKKAA